MKSLLVIIDGRLRDSGVVSEALRFCSGIAATGKADITIFFSENAIQTISFNFEDVPDLYSVNASFENLKGMNCKLLIPENINSSPLSSHCEKIDVSELARLSLRCDCLIKF